MSIAYLAASTDNGRRSVGGGRLLAGVRRALKQLVWVGRGVSIRNPPLPREVRSVMFLCKGNICRSPFAARLAQRIADEAGADVRCTSAGLVPSPDGRCPDMAVATAERFGVCLSAHRPVGVSETLMADHDLIVVMDAGQLRDLRARWPQYRARIVLLARCDPERRPLAFYEHVNIADPFGKGAEAFEHCYRRLDVSVRHLMSSITASQGLCLD
jgi:protein-tyrosine phosphatase